MSLFSSVMGPSFEKLHPALQKFHSMKSAQEFAGEVRTSAPTSFFAKLLAMLLGSPLEASTGPIRFTLHVSPSQERWTREFPGTTMKSVLTAVDGNVTEKLGAATLTFRVIETGGALEMQLAKMKFLGISCPGWLLPRIVAREEGRDNGLGFTISAHVVLIGQVVGYEGYLDIPNS